MPDNIGKAEFALGIAPVVFLRRDASNHLERTLADFFPVIVVPENGRFAGTGDFHKPVLLHVFDGLLEFFALIYFQSVADQAAKLGKTIFINSGEVEAGLALHALFERRGERFLRRWVVVHI